MLRQHCEDEGRDFGAIRKTILYTGESLDAPERFVEEMRAYHGLGIEGVMVMQSTPEQVRQLGDAVIPRLLEL